MRVSRLGVMVLRQAGGLDILKVDLAGRPFSTHLTDALVSITGGKIEVIESHDPAQRSSLDPAPITENELLLVAADAWFSVSALTRFLASVTSAPLTSKIVRSGAAGVDSGALLAIYLPFGEAKALMERRGSAVFRQAISQVAACIESFELVAGNSLDAVEPPLLIENLLDLSVLESRILYGRACAALLIGIRIRDPRRISIRGDLHCGKGVEIDLDVIIEGQVVLGDGVRVGAGSILINSKVGAGTRINPFSIVEESEIGSGGFVGPFGRIRPGSKIGNSSQIGNFVEIKNSNIGNGARINHLSFIGDATLEAGVTIGAGSITCNHNGAGATRTEIKAGAYVGSGCELVAPLSIGENATIGAGSTITEDVPAGKLTLARSRQVTVDDWVRADKKPSGK